MPKIKSTIYLKILIEKYEIVIEGKKEVTRTQESSKLNSRDIEKNTRARNFRFSMS